MWFASYGHTLHILCSVLYFHHADAGTGSKMSKVAEDTVTWCFFLFAIYSGKPYACLRCSSEQGHQSWGLPFGLKKFHTNELANLNEEICCKQMHFENITLYNAANATAARALSWTWLGRLQRSPKPGFKRPICGGQEERECRGNDGEGRLTLMHSRNRAANLLRPTLYLFVSITLCWAY